jgi:hypothetical protein
MYKGVNEQKYKSNSTITLNMLPFIWVVVGGYQVVDSQSWRVVAVVRLGKIVRVLN